MSRASGARGPLDGTRVLDLTRNIAGPYATMILAELGADVVKVEVPERGDDARGWGPPFWHGESPSFLGANRNKRSIALDLKHPQARGIMERLVDRSDVMVESFRPGSLDEMGFGYAWASERNPRLIYCSVSAYGETGPMAPLPGYDILMQALTGIMSVTGEADRPPVKAGVPIVDQGAGLWAALGVVAALLERERSGQTMRVGSSLYETSVGFMASHISAFWASGKPAGRFGSGTAYATPYEAFATADGHVMIACSSDPLFAKFADTLGHPEWATDPRFGTVGERVTNRVVLHETIERVTRTFSSEKLTATLEAALVPCGPIRDVSGVVGDAQAAAIGLFQTGEHPKIPGFKSVGLPLRLNGERPALRSTPPVAGAQTAEVLAEVGFSAEQVAALLASGATTGKPTGDSARTTK